MCGIWAILGNNQNYSINEHIDKLKNRGPESCMIEKINDMLTMGFTRLAINGLSNIGMMPFHHDQLLWICNGEIYNHIHLESSSGYSNKSGSDCEIIGPLFEYVKFNHRNFFRSLDGVFAIVLADLKNDRLIIGRDPYGVRPLYIASSSSKDTILFGSEFKSVVLNDCIVNVKQFLPGSYQVYQITTGKLMEDSFYHTIPYEKLPFLNEQEIACMAINKALRNAVKKRMMTERPVAALLSGGVDSSLIAALVQEQLNHHERPPLKTFSIGFEGSEDLKFASLVAKFIGSNHHEIVCTPDEFFEAIPQVIYDIESFDVTTVRASIGNWIVSKKIREFTDSKVVFNGDGSDEVFGSYLYFFNSPSEEDFCFEVERLLNDISLFDVLRSDRSISSHGLEARTPFLDKSFVATVLSIKPSLRRPSTKPYQMEKLILRKAFERDQLLPSEVLFRRKEAFSDGVSGMKTKSWFEEIQQRVDQLVNDNWTSQIKSMNFDHHLPPYSKESFYYRKIFHKFYPKHLAYGATPYYWMPKWCPNVEDPSARTLSFYSEKNE